jgi:hypothetical protein
VKTLLALAAFVLLAMGVWWFVFRTPPPRPGEADHQPQPVSVSSFDDFNKDLAKRVTDVLVPGGAADFQVVVTPATDPIGTLYRKGRSVPFDDTACAPSAEPVPRSLPNAFPSYTLDAKVAADVGVDQALLQGVADLGTSIDAETSFNFSILDARMKVLTDRAVEQLLAASSCAAAATKEMVIVRGYVAGQRQFSTKSNRTGSAGAGVRNVGKFKVEADNGGLISITDNAPQEFLQILSEITTPAEEPSTGGGQGTGGAGGRGARGGTPPVQPPVIAAPTEVTGQGRIYVQQDQADTTGNGQQIVSALRSDGFAVEPQVERTATRLTPDRPQVRYFNEADKAKATMVLESLKEKYPDAVLVPLKIKAPPGQLEVWLPRAGTDGNVTRPTPSRDLIPGRLRPTR